MSQEIHNKFKSSDAVTVFKNVGCNGVGTV